MVAVCLSGVRTRKFIIEWVFPVLFMMLLVLYCFLGELGKVWDQLTKANNVHCY